MAKFRMWRDNKTNDYKFVDRHIKSYFDVSGTKMLIHKYIGTYDDNGNPIDGVKIEDLLFMESRNRRYGKDLFELMCIYEMSDDDFELSQFGFMKTDTLYLDFHMNEMAKRIGRKLSAGDVIEVIHLRDDLLDDREGAINTYYVVEEGRRPVAGYSSNWLPHMWRVRVSKMTDSVEFSDITDDNDDFLSIIDKLEDANEAVVNEAEKEVPDNGSELDYVYDERYDGALEPEPGLDLDSIESGHRFPMYPEDGDYFIRDDYRPRQVFKYEDGKWQIVNVKKYQWTGPHEFTESFVQNENSDCINGEEVQERGYITNPLGLEDDDDE